jgi:hypothetical protein
VPKPEGGPVEYSSTGRVSMVHRTYEDYHELGEADCHRVTDINSSWSIEKHDVPCDFDCAAAACLFMDVIWRLVGPAQRVTEPKKCIIYR